MGASNVDLDSEAGWVNFALDSAQNIDIGRVTDTLESASYQLRSVQIELEGEIVGDDASRTLIVTGTGQRLPVVPDSTGNRGNSRVRAAIEGWHEGSPRLRVLPDTEQP